MDMYSVHFLPSVKAPPNTKNGGVSDNLDSLAAPLWIDPLNLNPHLTASSFSARLFRRILSES